MIRELVLASRPVSWVNTAFPFGAAYLLAGGTVDVLFVLGVVFFLTFLCWLTMNLYTGCSRILRARADRAASRRVAGAGGQVAGAGAPRSSGTAGGHDPRTGGQP